MSIIKERVTHHYDGDLVVFLIGMRVNRWWRPDLWVPVFREMGPMLTELFTDPESGLLGVRFTMGLRGPTLVQYWSSVDKLYAYASAPTAAHRPAWARFNKLVRKAPGAVGIWHETFTVAKAESIYVGLPPSGLAKATTLVPVTPRLDRARDRYDAA
jgi:hypothetical protein